MSAAQMFSAPARHVSEAAWQEWVEVVAEWGRWLVQHNADSRRADSGFPDLVLARAEDRRVVFAELKTETGKFRKGRYVRRGRRDVWLPGQDEWAAALMACPCEYHLWRPSDWLDVLKTLAPVGWRVVETQVTVLAEPAPVEEAS